MAKKIIWVKSADGRPVHLKDVSLNDKEIDIDGRMIEQGIALPVQDTPFVRGKMTEHDHILAQELDEEKAKEKYDAFQKKVEAERKERAKELGIIEKSSAKIAEIAKKAAEEAIKAELNKQKKPVSKSKADEPKAASSAGAMR